MRAVNPEAAFRVVIVGGGTAGWMCAAGMSRLLDPRDYAITLVESDEIATVGVGEATLPHIKTFNDMLSVDEVQFLRETQGTFKLGIEFRNWGRAGDRYIHPFGTFGEPWAGVDFQHHWARARLHGLNPAPLQDYSYAVAAARANAFEFPNEDQKSIRSTYAYAYHFDAGLYAAYLRRWSTARGVTRIEGLVTDIAQDGERGDVTAITLKSGKRIDGDLFVDCSGFRSLLLGGLMKAEWEDWTKWLPCDRALAVPCARADAFSPYTRSTAQEGGWIWRIPLQHRTGNGYVFSSAFMDADRARETLLAQLDAPAQAEPKLLRFAAGRRKSGWTRNVVAMGLASGFLEPLESTSIFLIQAAVVDLINLMPTRRTGMDPRLAAEFNRLFEIQYDRIRDFLILHYRLNQRVGQPLWDHVRTMEIPASLEEKLALFEGRAGLPDYKYGLFSRDSWLSVLEGQGLTPRAYDRLAEAVPLDVLGAKLADLKTRIDTNVAAMSSHADFIARYAPGGVGAPMAKAVAQ
ncbi:tryptophan halogenase family protein [Caulobacter segnis]|uniref:tryptophan halogenase family protein n=1 Tax=Caulobacter segnis TaxID=88688 RepID=UPI001CC0C68F|nr:tryptophan halogenase family protein [Caulobacter segnis]UAL10122.1 tryptophan 7-halogenase [Caulobacter segnis]